jgi:hypothetical protein
VNLRLFLVLLVLPLAAEASAWKRWCGADTSTGLAVGQYACILPASNADDSVILSVGACENIDVGLTGDLNGDGASASSLTATLQWCPVSQTDATVNTDAKRDAACVDYTNGTMTGDGTLQGAGIPTGFVRINMGGTFAADPVVFVKCNGPH